MSLRGRREPYRVLNHRLHHEDEEGTNCLTTPPSHSPASPSTNCSSNRAAIKLAAESKGLPRGLHRCGPVRGPWPWETLSPDVSPLSTRPHAWAGVRRGARAPVPPPVPTPLLARGRRADGCRAASWPTERAHGWPSKTAARGEASFLQGHLGWATSRPRPLRPICSPAPSQSGL